MINGMLLNFRCYFRIQRLLNKYLILQDLIYFLEYLLCGHEEKMHIKKVGKEVLSERLLGIVRCFFIYELKFRRKTCK